MSTTTYAAVEKRIAQTTELQPYRDILLADWPEGEEHLRWALNAPVNEIIDWAMVIRRGEADMADQNAMNDNE